MSFQPPSLDVAEGRRELCSGMLARTDSSALIPGQRGGRRGSVSTCLHLSTAWHLEHRNALQHFSNPHHLAQGSLGASAHP